MISSKQYEDDQLFRVIIEQLKVPLLQIARQTELAKSGTLTDYNDINSIAEMSIKLIDSCLLTAGQHPQLGLELEPVSISSVLNTAAENLNSLSKLYNCSIELKMGGKYAPVMSQKANLEAAFTMLGYAFIEANSGNLADNDKGRIVLSGYQTSKGLVAGIFSPSVGITNDSFNRAIDSFGKAKQALPEFSQSTGAGIFIANKILDNMATKLRVAHYKRLNGLAATLIQSQQLQLV